MTAYVLISLLESGIELPEDVSTNAKFCIRGLHTPDKYTLAISTYALFLVKWETEATKYLDKLIKGFSLTNTSKGGTTFLLRSSNNTKLQLTTILPRISK